MPPIELGRRRLLSLAGAGAAAGADPEPWLAALGPTPAVLSGLWAFADRLPSLAALLARHPTLRVDSSVQTHQQAAALFDDLERRPADWAAFLEAHSDRVLLASGIRGGPAMGWAQYPRLLRCLRWVLERRTFYRARFDRGRQDEWSATTTPRSARAPAWACPPRRWTRRSGGTSPGCGREAAHYGMLFLNWPAGSKIQCPSNCPST